MKLFSEHSAAMPDDVVSELEALLTDLRKRAGAE